MSAALTMTKLVVGDVDAASAFYTAVCGLAAVERIDTDAYAEIVMGLPVAESAALVLIAFKGSAPPPPPGACILVFETGDVARFVARAVAAGGSVIQPALEIADKGLTYALVRDPEGHLLQPLHRGVAAG